jgi:hypothetical protein
VSKTDFKPGETVRVTLMATNSGVSISPLCVLNIFDSIDDVVYDSHPVGEDNSSLQELSSQSGTGYFSFDWTIPQNAVLGNYNLGAVIRAQEDWETLYDETNVGANTTTFSNGWILQNKFSVSTDVQTDWNLFNVTDIGNGEHQMVAVRDQTEYAYIELEWDGKSDMHISFDLKTPTGFSYAEYIRFGLFKAGFHENFDYGSENVRWFHYGYADGQSAMKAKVTISEYGGFGMNPATNEWFTYSMDYDYSLQVLTAKFTDSSGNVVFSKSFENILFDSETIIFRNLQYSFTNDVVPTNTQVSSTTITSGSTDCFNATQTITVAGDGDVIVESGASANFIAGQNIRFLPGFHAQAGSYTHGYITTTGDYCVEAPPALVAVEQANTKEGVITVAGITEQAKKEMVVYPNPNNGEFTVEFRNFENEIRVMLFNSIGQLIRNLKTNEKQMRISLPNLESGMYYLKAVSNNQQFSQKIVVR